MRTSIFLIFGAFSLSLFGQGNTIDWRDGRPGVRVVTNSLQTGEIMGLIDVAGQAKAGTGDVARIEGEVNTHVQNEEIHIDWEQAQRIANAVTNDHTGLYYPLAGGNLSDGATLSIRSAPSPFGQSTTTLEPQGLRFSAPGTKTTTLYIPAHRGLGEVIGTIATIEDLDGVVTKETDPVALPLLSTHTNDAAIHLTTEQVVQIAQEHGGGEEQDLAALRAYHYGSPDIVESPAEWFVFDGAGTITGFNREAGRENVVIPWAIGGVPVTVIGANVFRMSGIVSVSAPQTVTTIGNGAFISCTALTSINLPQAASIADYAFLYCSSLTSINLPQAASIADYAFLYCSSLTSINLPQATAIRDQTFSGCSSLTSLSLPNATAIGDSAFLYCSSLTSINLPQAQTIGDSAFADCHSLTSVTIPQATAIGDYAFSGCSSLTSVNMGRNAPAEAADVFADINPSPTVYVTDPQATGWGAVWNGAPVVRPPLYGSNVTAQAITLGGDTITEWPSGGGSVPYADWTGTVTPQNGTATVTYAHGNMPVLVTDAPCVLTLDPTGYGTAGVSRVSLSYYTGTNSFTFATNIIDYAATPTVDTNGWNTLLIRRVSDGAWKGVGL